MLEAELRQIEHTGRTGSKLRLDAVSANADLQGLAGYIDAANDFGPRWTGFPKVFRKAVMLAPFSSKENGTRIKFPGLRIRKPV